MGSSIYVEKKLILNNYKGVLKVLIYPLAPQGGNYKYL
jgi:hypothetical protein